MRNVMTKAWEIAKEAVVKFGGKVKEYFAESLKLAWSMIKGENTMENNVINDFFEKWEKEVIEWYKSKQEEFYKMGYTKWAQEVRPNISKNAYKLIAHCSMKSVVEMIAKDMEIKKSVLLSKINKTVGDIIELDLVSGQDGTPNGYVTGTEGKVRIETIVAGGYNVQCVHYRVLIKKMK